MKSRLLRLLLGGILIFTGLAAPSTARPVSAQQPAPPAQFIGDEDPEAPAIDAALQEAIRSTNGEVLAFVIYQVAIDHIQFTPDRQTALVWLAMIDPTDGQVIATEPGLAIADRQGEEWQITLQANAAWAERFEKLPAGLLPEEYRAYFDTAAKEDNAINTVYYGYKLPWGGGQAKTVEGSIGHFLIYHSCSEAACRYAYDFADGTMFPLLAARGGTVKRWYDGCTNGDENCTNYLVLEDRSTSPYTYQLYMHLANNTIPAELKSVGVNVNQGQFIGNVDDTGYSTGHHLHFMVHTNPSSYWGNSVDIRFDDVDVNGGVPRTENETTTYPQYGTGFHQNDLYVSGNALAIGPTGSLTQPQNLTTITTRSLSVSGWGTDDRGVIKMQVRARTVDSGWFDLGAAQTGSAFTAEIDLCAAGIPDGPLTLALQLWDVEGNTGYDTQYRTIYKQHTCQPIPPACQPSANQVALFTLENYTGSCQLFDPGSYVLNGVLNNQVRSLSVGDNAIAVLYTGNNFDERRESWATNDPNLADNPVDMDSAGSLRVLSRATPPVAPQIVTPHNTESQLLTSNDSILLSWIPGDGATEFSASLNGPGGLSRVLDWQTIPTWNLGSLPGGVYTLTVSGRSPAGATASTVNFVVYTASLPAGTPRSLPYENNFENTDSEWSATGLWQRDNPTLGSGSNARSTYTWGFTDGVDYDNGGIRGGNLTSPPILIPAEGGKFFFEYYYSLADEQTVWDERWLQISVNDSDFVNFYQFQNDRMNAWLISPLFDLSAYAGQTIRLRWYFHTVDGMNNGAAGWFIDNLAVYSNPPVTSCIDIPANDTPAQATTIVPYGRSDKLFLCPSGDLDYYTFEAQAGDTLNLWIEAQSVGSSVDGVLYLLDSDGASVLAWSDDPASGVYDPKLKFQFTHTGRYYLRFRDYRHPGFGGVNYYYYINIYLASAPPQVTISYPNSIWLPVLPIQLTALVNNPGGQTSKVEFYRHSSNWNEPAWTLLGSDTNGSNGWTLNYTPSLDTDQGATLFVRAVDRSGQTGGAIRWNLGVDSTVPYATFQPLPSQTESTYIPLSWSAGDSGSGLAVMELLFQINQGSWQPWTPLVALNVRKAGYLGQPGQSLAFRLNAQDAAGNLASPASQTSTVIETSCTPDIFETVGDNQMANAVHLPAGIFQEHNFCAAADEDWLSFTASETASYLVMAQSLSGGAAASLEVYNFSGTLLFSTAAPEFGASAALRLEVTQGESYYLRIQPIDPNLQGSQVRYQAWVGPGFWVHLPLINR